MRVKCEIEEVELDGESGRAIEGVSATCARCGHTTESYGTSGASVRRCLVAMREECPRGENNFYVSANMDDDRP